MDDVIDDGDDVIGDGGDDVCVCPYTVLYIDLNGVEENLSAALRESLHNTLYTRSQKTSNRYTQ